MKITKISNLTGITHTQEINVTQEQLDAHEAGGLIQVVAPDLTEDEREFIISGITAAEWETLRDEDDMGEEDGNTFDGNDENLIDN